MTMQIYDIPRTLQVFQPHYLIAKQNPALRYRLFWMAVSEEGLLNALSKVTQRVVQRYPTR